MKVFKYILPLLIALSACQPKNAPDRNSSKPIDSLFIIADIQWHNQHYPLLDQNVFSIDLLSQGLLFDSVGNIVGTGYNLYISDIFLPLSDTCLQAGNYQMDTTAAAYTFLPYMNFDGKSTGSYLLDIQNNNLKRIIGFTTGEMQVEYIGEDILLDVTLYTADSTRYHAIYQGPASYD